MVGQCSASRAQHRRTWMRWRFSTSMRRSCFLKAASSSPRCRSARFACAPSVSHFARSSRSRSAASARSAWSCARARSASSVARARRASSEVDAASAARDAFATPCDSRSATAS